MINCKEMAQDIKDKVKVALDGKTANLCVIQVGNDEASNAYIRGKKRDCEEVGIGFNHLHLSESCTTLDVVNLIRASAESYSCNGVIVQLPLPEHIDKEIVAIELASKGVSLKDVDGFSKNSVFKPCTPLGIMHIIEKLGVDLDGKNVTLIGRGDLVGKPLSKMLLDKNVTLTWCNSHTKNLKQHTINADIIITAVGKKDLITLDMVNENQIIIDAGITRCDGKLYGDCDKAIYDKVELITHTPNGVALLTRAFLLNNVCLGRTFKSVC